MNKKLIYGISLSLLSLAILLGWFWPKPWPRNPSSPGLDAISNPEDPLGQANLIQEIHRLNALGHLETVPVNTRLPFTYLAEHIIVSARLNNADSSHRFLWDSGVSAVFLDQELADTLGIQGQLPCDQDVSYCTLSTVTVAEAEFSQIGTFILPFSDEQQPVHCLSGNGILGGTVLSHGIWQINYDQQIIHITDNLNNLAYLEGAIVLPFRDRKMTPIVDLQIGNGVVIPTLIDTGANVGISITQADFESANGPLEANKLIKIQALAENVQGLTTHTLVIGNTQELQLGTLSLPNYPVLIHDVHPSQFISKIGNQFLSHFIVTLDWQTQTLYLLPTSFQAELYPVIEGYGIQIGLQSEGLQITGLYQPSPAHQAGLQIGDRILKINQDDYTNLSDHQFCQLLLDPVLDHYDQRIQLLIERNNQVLTYEIKPDKLLSRD